MAGMIDEQTCRDAIINFFDKLTKQKSASIFNGCKIINLSKNGKTRKHATKVSQIKPSKPQRKTRAGINEGRTKL